MRRCRSRKNRLSPLIAGGILLCLAAGCALGADDSNPIDIAGIHSHHDLEAEPSVTERVSALFEELVQVGMDKVRRIGLSLSRWYVRTPPPDRVTWGGMTACAGLGLGVLLERLARLRRHKIIPVAFTASFLDRLYAGRLDCGEALDHCERNPSPAARIALAAVRRWGRPAPDLERAVSMAHRSESERLRRNVGTLRRIAVMAPLLGLLGTLFALGRALEGIATAAPPGLNLTVSAPVGQGTLIAWGPMLAAALSPLSVGLIVATLALVAYDGLLTRIEKLAGSLDRLGTETIDAIAMSAPAPSQAILLSPVATNARTPHQSTSRRDAKDASASQPAARQIDEHTGN
jgi:biopolymer transport protein ExbB